jgi:hypothetical protein
MDKNVAGMDDEVIEVVSLDFKVYSHQHQKTFLAYTTMQNSIHELIQQYHT